MDLFDKFQDRENFATKTWLGYLTILVNSGANSSIEFEIEIKIEI